LSFQALSNRIRRDNHGRELSNAGFCHFGWQIEACGLANSVRPGVDVPVILLDALKWRKQG